jgi:2,5-furandicarboxylate decarboxylase 1
VVVDDDVDVTNPEDVEWAVATRFCGDSGLVRMADMKARSIDLVKDENGLITKVGVDATVPSNARETFARIGVPTQTKRAVARKIARLDRNPKTARE